jgi:hypothetical protein
MFDPCIAHQIKLSEIKRLEETLSAFFFCSSWLCVIFCVNGITQGHVITQRFQEPCSLHQPAVSFHCTTRLTPVQIQQTQAFCSINDLDVFHKNIIFDKSL